MTSLSDKQAGVLKGMAGGALAAVVNIVVGGLYAPLQFSSALTLEQRLGIAAKAGCIVALILMASIGRLAKHRFFSPEDIDAAASGHASRRAHVLQAILQNTLEQTVLAVVTYFVWAIVMPAAYLGVVVGAAALFVLGRFVFFRGYETGAAARSLGFALTFYPTALMLATLVVRSIF